jgi:hypothetical protein
VLESLIEYLNALVTPLGFRTYGLTHLVEKEDISFPAIYERKGEFSPMDGEVPTVYHRLLDGPNDTDDPEDESPVNNPIVTRTYSMRAVAVFPFDLYGDDNQYQEDKVIRNLNNQLKQRNIKTLRASLKLIEVSSQPGASARGTDVWEEEFAGIDWKGKRRIVSVDYDVTFRGFADCVATIGCGEGQIDVTQAIIDEYCPECEETPCDPASITTNADSPALEVASGASQDIAIHDSAGADVGTRSGATVTVGDGSVSVNGSGSIPVKAEGSANIDVEDTAGADVGTLAGTTVTVADTTVTVNSSAYDTTEAESTLNVQVVDGGDSPVGSLSGGKWVVPDEYFVAITADETETTLEFTVFFKDGGTRTVSAETLTNGSIDTGGVVVNAAAGVNTFVGVSLSDGDTVELTYTASGGDFLVELEF